MASDNPAPVIHAKDVGDWAREHLGYQPLKPPEPETVSIPVKGSPYPQLRSGQRRDELLEYASAVPNRAHTKYW